MAFTYDINTNIGKVRLFLGDTDTNDVLLKDEEIEFYLKTYGRPQLAASYAAMAIAAKFSRDADKQVGSLRINLSSRADNYKRLSVELKTNASSVLTPYIGGISISDKTINEVNADRVAPSFRRGGNNG